MRTFLALLFALPAYVFAAATRVEGYSEQGFLGREGVVAQFTRVRAGWSDSLGFLYLHLGQDWASTSTSPTQPAGSFAYAGPGLRFGNGIASLALEARQLWRYAPAVSGSNDWDARAVGVVGTFLQGPRWESLGATLFAEPYAETVFSSLDRSNVVVNTFVRGGVRRKLSRSVFVDGFLEVFGAADRLGHRYFNRVDLKPTLRLGVADRAFGLNLFVSYVLNDYWRRDLLEAPPARSDRQGVRVLLTVGGAL